MRKTLQELGIPIYHPEKIKCWRKPSLQEIKSNILIGKQFKTTRGKTFICERIDKDFIYFYSIKMEVKYCRFFLPTIKQLTTKEQIDMLHDKYPGSHLHTGQGCQLHGDIDATLTLENGDVIIIPWNY